MENKAEERYSAESSKDTKICPTESCEEEELGEFFSRLADLVPQCEKMFAKPSSDNTISCEDKLNLQTPETVNCLPKSTNTIKSKRSNHRSVPYRIAKPNPLKSSAIPIKTNSSVIHSEGQLQLLTDVIEYISNLQKILESKSGGSPNGVPPLSQDGSLRDQKAHVDKVMELLEHKTGTISLTA